MDSDGLKTSEFAAAMQQVLVKVTEARQILVELAIAAEDLACDARALEEKLDGITWPVLK